jgi:hexosaminidase
LLDKVLEDRVPINLGIAEANGTIRFKTADPGNSNPEAYKLTVGRTHILIQAKTYGGFANAIQTLRQLMPAKAYGRTDEAGVDLQCVEIADYPRFKWRGMMLDCSRQFFDVDTVKNYIDYLAMHKINVFHWHLTDDDGWRMEVKGYPELTAKGAWRGKDCVLKASRGSSPDGRYGGFYTQEQIKEIVAYALERNVNIMPEIDVPGHGRSATASYPEILCDSTVDAGKSVQGVKSNVWCAGREENFKMLDAIITQCAELFPFEYIHIGGDEVNKKAWSTCRRCKKLMADQNMKNVGNVQNYFIRRMETIVRSHGKKMMGWNEILHGGELKKDTAIMAWIGTGPGYHAAKKGHPVIMSPGPYTYFDMAQYPGERGHWWAGVVSTEKTYSFDPMKNNDLKPEQLKNIFGVEACLWSEYLDTPEGQIWYQTFPRLCALAEVCWTPQKERSWEDFNERLHRTHLDRLDALKVAYRVPHPTAKYRKGMVTIAPPYRTEAVRYTTNGKEPTENSPLWSGKQFLCENTGMLRMKTFRPNGRTSPTIRGAKPLPLIHWDEKTFTATEKVWTVDTLGYVDEDGSWSLEFRKTWHRNDKKDTVKNSVKISTVELIRDGTVIATHLDPFSLGQTIRSRLCKFKVTGHKQGQKYTLKVTGSFPKGNQNKGMLILDKSPFMEPEVESVTTNMPAYGNNDKDNVVDWMKSTYFWVSRSPKKGDMLTIVFKDPVTSSYLTVQTGKLNASQDILVEGTVEVSIDGTSFTKFSDFEFGTAKGELKAPVKAIRINCIAGQGKEWLIIQDLKFKR